MNLKLLATVLSLAPTAVTFIRNTVQDIETLFPSLQGSQKFAAAEARINSVLDKVAADVEEVGQLKDAVKMEIDSAVAMFNAAGTFTKKTVQAAGTSLTGAFKSATTTGVTGAPAAT